MKYTAMRLLLIAIPLVLATAETNAQSAQRQFTVPTSRGSVTVDGYDHCAKLLCPAVLILSGSKGSGAPVYEQIGQTFQAAGFKAYLVHALSPADIDTIDGAGSAQARIAYYAKRLPDWISAVRGVIAYLEAQPQHGEIGVLGISLGAQIASAASAGRSDVGALVLVDGGLPNGYPRPTKSLPPLLLLWGSADRTFPLAIGRDLQRSAQKLGGPASLNVYENGSHDFFLKAGTHNADAAHQAAIEFLRLYLSR